MTRRREAALVVTLAVVTTVALTSPLAFRLGTGGRVDSPDGQFSIWNVAWVARTVVVDPLGLFDANFFFPHRNALAFSEANLVAGLVAVVPYWLTRNPYAAHNTVVLLSFMLSLVGTYLLVRHLTGSGPAAAVAGVLFAFCPFVFARSAHIQLLMTAGLPFSMLAFHRLVDRPGVKRGVTLGLVLAATGLACGYYGLFTGLMVGVAILFYAAADRLWASRAYWTGIAVAVVTGGLVSGVFFLPYLEVGDTHGAFVRTLDDARMYSAVSGLRDTRAGWNRHRRRAAESRRQRPYVSGSAPGRPTQPGGRALRADRRAGLVGIARTFRRALHGPLRGGPGVRDAAGSRAARHRGGDVARGAGGGRGDAARPRPPGGLGHDRSHPGRHGRAGGGAVSPL